MNSQAAINGWMVGYMVGQSSNNNSSRGCLDLISNQCKEKSFRENTCTRTYYNECTGQTLEQTSDDLSGRFGLGIVLLTLIVCIATIIYIHYKD